MDALHFDLKEELWNSTQAKPIIPNEVAGLWIRKQKSYKKYRQ